MMTEEIRFPLLLRLAEQAMSDAAFREVARASLDDALAQYRYDLNPREHALVMEFRRTLEKAGVDLFLTKELDLGALDDGLLAQLIAGFDKR